ncbi:hypothetical protein ACM15_23665 [Parabacteroides goldsteinii]|uniref:Glycosyltransferase n=1 Tax=Parabacteroides goldsteinii TaxID=328812 RepID=A0A0J6C4G9_9BACT|nr:glycosyltransferase family 4 protein [Parabacteroides goldsteinii]KMM31221.1 hypothetical protein ACM15_23665 [Parabacteroides goldsteinii]
MKKVLEVASVISFFEWFNKENIDYLRNTLKCEVHIVANMDYLSDTDEDRTKKYIEKLKLEGVILHNIHFDRSPFSFCNILAYKRLKKIIDDNRFDLIHCHTPVVSVLTRLAAIKSRKRGCVVMYTCHGFNFHNKSSKLNWLLFYPIERFFSHYCDYIVTINREDFYRARSFHATHVRYIPGVGVNINQIFNTKIDKKIYRKSLGIPEEAIMIISIGEMIGRKNHEVIIQALGKLQHPNIYYVICGKGPLREHLEHVVNSLNISQHVLFLGFRKDISELCHAADISAFPSRIEGLGLAGIEAMAAGIPLISSNVHGILDYVIDGVTGYSIDPEDVDGFAKAIEKLANNPALRQSMRNNCIEAVKPFELNSALHKMWDIFDEILY